MRFPIKNRFKKTSSPTLILAVICLGIFVAALDQTVVYGALPGMMVDIQLPVTKLDQASWIVIGYFLGYTFAMPLMGQVSDRYGHSRIYILSLIIFIAGSILVALSANLQWMVGARVIQAIGGGAVVPIAMAIVGDLYVGKNRAVALGIIGAVVEAGGALGPFYGAVLSQFWGWRWIIIVISLFLKPSPRTGGKIDYVDGFLLAAGLALLSLGLSQQPGQAHFWTYMPIFIIAALIIFTIFIVRIRRVDQPLINLSMFRNVTFSMANITNFLVGGALIIAMVSIPVMSDTILGTSPLGGGLRLLRFTALLSIGAVAGGFLTKRFGYRVPTILGLILSAAGFFLMSRWMLTIADPQMTIDLAVCGFGFGLVIAPLGTAIIDSAAEQHRGIASSLVVMMRMTGMIVGLAAITSWGMEHFHLLTASMSLSEIVNTPENISQSLLIIFHGFFLASIGICLIAIVPAVWLGRKNNPLPIHQ
jgi:MFS family permease